MKILFVLGKYLPDKNGGIENYCHSLSKVLQNHHHVEVAILESPHSESYLYDDVKVFPLINGIQSFKLLLEEEHYDICHFHEYSAYGGIEMDWFKEAAKCSKIYFTFHLPYFTCYKNDFRYKGITDCNQFNSVFRCLECVISTKLNYQKKEQGTPLYNAGVDFLKEIIIKSGISNGIKKRITANQRLLEELINSCDKIFIIAAWFQEVLDANGYHSPKFFLLPPLPQSPENQIDAPDVSLKDRLLFVGRIEPIKGLLLLCKAMNDLSKNDLSLDVYGNIVDEKYFQRCMEVYPFNYRGILPRKELLEQFVHYDFLVLPSVFTEMYPMVIQEAFNAGLPVIASTAKGNRDMICDGKNGFLFEYDNSDDLARVIEKAYDLKNRDWVPQFDTADTEEHDLKQILSYYS